MDCDGEFASEFLAKSPLLTPKAWLLVGYVKRKDVAMKEHEQAEVALKALATARAASDCNRRISAHDVRHICGGVSDMTLWRWLNVADFAFPKPIYIGRRRYWKESDVLAWLDAKAEAAT